MLVSSNRDGRDKLWHTSKCVLQLKEKATSRFQPLTATWKRPVLPDLPVSLRELESQMFHVKCPFKSAN